MTELLFQAITQPQSGESTKWWQLFYSETKADFADGVQFGDTLFIKAPETNSPLTIGEDVKRIFAPLINVKFDPIEVTLTNDEIELPDLDEEPEQFAQFVTDVETFVTDIANTAQNLFITIEGQGVSNPEDYRQAEGPFSFTVAFDNDLQSTLSGGNYDNAFADGFYVGFDPSLLPSFPDGIDVNFGGEFDLTGLVDENDPTLPPGNTLDPIYEQFSGFGVFPQDLTYTFKFDLNEVPGSNKRNNLKGTAGRDKIEAGNGKDRLTGAGGNDYLDGGNGQDILNGTGRGADGSGEIDVLRGGNGKDIFVLGRSSTTYYLGGGDSDYAIIEDFKIQNDLFKLGSNPGNYVVNGDYTIGGQSGAGISFQDYDGNLDLVAIVVGVSVNDLTPLEDFVI